MDFQTISSLVSTLGFPIVCCAALFWYQAKSMKDFTDEIKDTIDKLSENLSVNSEALVKLVTTVEVISKK